MKLSNGEFLSPQGPELTYQERCPSVDGCVLFARAGDVMATAIVVLRTGAAESGCGIGWDASDATGSAAAVVLEEMRAAAAAAGLRSWEVPGRVVIDPGPWDDASGCSSAHGKVRRLAIAKRNHLLPAVLGGDGGDGGGSSGGGGVGGGDGGGGGGGHDQGGSVNAGGDADAGGGSLLDATMGFLIAPSDAKAATLLPAAFAPADAAEGWWNALGGDSILASELVVLWEQHARSAHQPARSRRRAPSQPPPGLTVHDIFSLSGRELRRKAQARLGLHSAPAADGVPSGSDEDEDEELDVEGMRACVEARTAFWEREASASTASAMAMAAAAAIDGEHDDGCDHGRYAESEEGPSVLLTSATGFLGPHLLAALLSSEHARPWRTVAVLVRGATERVRLPAAAAAAASTGVDTSAEPSRCRVRAFLADLSQPDLGLAADDRAALRRMGIRAVMHSAAIVDHARPYEALHATNVGAIAALVALISLPVPLPPRPPPLVVLVSTMSVIPVAAAAAGVGVAATQTSLVPPACAAALESGYAQSKLVAEHHLAAAERSGHLRLIVARLGLIGSPTDAAAGDGYAGRRDWLSLLLCAVEATGASPAGLTSRQRGVAVLPVDLAARALAAQAATALEVPTTGTAAVEAPTTASLRVPGQRSGEDDAATGEAAAEGAEAGGAGSLPPIRLVYLDAAAFGLPPRPLSSLLDEVEAARGPGRAPLRRELPYPNWRRLVSAAGPPAVLALAMLPPEGRGGVLRLPSGARRRLRDMRRLADESIVPY